MSTKRSFFVLGVLGVSATFGACKDKQPEQAATSAATPSAAPSAAPAGITREQATAVFKPLATEMTSAENPITDAKVELGRTLYYDERLSKNQDVSCNTCHLLDKYGVDGTDVSVGHKKAKGTRNAPTVYNAAAHFVQFWDGRSPNVEHQATQPVLNPVEMAMPDEAAVLKVLQSIPEYVEAFKKAFPDDKEALTYANMGKAIGAFERKLVTPSRWDKYLAGDDKAITDEEKMGAKAFMDANCTTCHQGEHLGGTMYQKAGLVKPWPNQKDQGRFDVTKAEADKMMFKVPGLRNIEKTAPYFHDASAKTLEEAVQMMSEYQFNKKLDDKQVASIVAFLKTLTGDLPMDLIKKPELPKSGPKTPKPDPN
ncbi:MAG: cytochrome-c peroxidase [Polyangiaceae bacterium]